MVRLGVSEEECFTAAEYGIATAGENIGGGAVADQVSP